MKIKCVIIDDEPLAIKVIENHLKEFQNFEGERKKQIIFWSCYNWRCI